MPFKPLVVVVSCTMKSSIHHDAQPTPINLSVGSADLLLWVCWCALFASDTIQAAAAHQCAPAPAVTASDVVLALTALGGELNEGSLASYVRTHIHGSVSSLAIGEAGAGADTPDSWVAL